jgi:single-stranded-DNA-specific exonuclease
MHSHVSSAEGEEARGRSREARAEDGTEYTVRPADPDAARELGRACGVGPAAAQVLLHRGLEDAPRARDFLEAKLSGLTPPGEMADRLAAADRLATAIRNRERIAVFGDYDVDGTTSAAILSGILRALGGDAVALVADRFAGGYGFSDEALARCRAIGARVIVTCDCGSSDHPRIAEAMGAGVDVIVVDHHLVPDESLPALAFLNPHRPDCGFPYKGLASAGLALSVGAAVRAQLGSSLDVRSWLDLVALGTVADVAPLDGDNRRLVRAGLRRLASNEARPGLAALREMAKLRAGTPIGAVDIAFRLAPRLNAAGRLGHSTVTLDLLQASSVEEARAVAARIEQLNEERKRIGEEVMEQALAQVREVYGEAPATGVVVAAEGWHRGVVGIVAARLVEQLGVPVACAGFDGAVGHGSVRGPEGARLHDALGASAAALESFGGHQAAAGFVLATRQLDAFRAAFGDATRVVERARSTRPTVDVEVDGTTFPLPTADDLMRLEPLGEANRAPVFALPRARVEARRVVGDRHLAVTLRVGRASLRAFGRNMARRLERLPETWSPVGELRPDTYRGDGSVELILAPE